MPDNQILALVIGTMAAIALNFLPTAVAFGRRHPDRMLLAKLNPLSLLSFLLWTALMAWALGSARNDAVINRFVHSRANRGLLIGIVVVLVGGGLLTSAVMLGAI